MWMVAELKLVTLLAYSTVGVVWQWLVRRCSEELAILTGTDGPKPSWSEMSVI